MMYTFTVKAIYIHLRLDRITLKSFYIQETMMGFNVKALHIHLHSPPTGRRMALQAYV